MSRTFHAARDSRRTERARARQRRYAVISSETRVLAGGRPTFTPVSGAEYSSAEIRASRDAARHFRDAHAEMMRAERLEGR